MALLKISEPGGKTPPPPRRLAVGIDLGTTNSLVSARCGDRVEALPDGDGEALLPSAVRYLADGPPVVGRAARAALAEDPANTALSVKRWLGRSLDEIKALPHAGRHVFDPERPDTAPAILTAAGSRDPVEISADILRALKARAAAALKGEPEGAVITVPAHFGDAERQQTRDAAERAGLRVLRLLNEPTAAAVAYGLDSRDQGEVLVFDLGGGTFDASLLSLRKGVFEVLATGGDTLLGGDDFDQALVEWLCGRAGREADPALRLYATELRHRLSEEESVEAAVGDWRGRVAREDLARLCGPLVARAVAACRRVLRDGGMETEDIDSVVLVGGATRMPMVREAVERFFGRAPLDGIDPDRVVAVGAGIQADVLIGNRPQDGFLLLDVTPLSLGIETMGELVEKIIPRNTAIPAARAQEFTTFKDGQTAMSLHVVQGERELVGDCRSLARFELRGIPPMTAGAAKVRVTFQVDADGLLGVTAEELGAGRRAEVQVRPSYGLEAETVERMLRASHERARDDMAARAIKEAQLDARRLLEAVRAAVEADGGLLDREEAAGIERAAAALAEAADSETDVRRLRELTEALNEASGGFAARRMDLRIGQALHGESIDRIEEAG